MILFQGVVKHFRIVTVERLRQVQANVRPTQLDSPQFQQ